MNHSESSRETLAQAAARIVDAELPRRGFTVSALKCSELYADFRAVALAALQQAQAPQSCRVVHAADCDGECDEQAQAPAPAWQPIETDDYEWALDRVTRMCSAAFIDAQVYGKKLLKGFGYPNETFGRAQDYRALSIMLERMRVLDHQLEARMRQALL